MAAKKNIVKGTDGGRWIIEYINEKNESMHRRLNAVTEKEAISEFKKILPIDIKEGKVGINGKHRLVYRYEVLFEIKIQAIKAKTPKTSAISKTEIKPAKTNEVEEIADLLLDEPFDDLDIPTTN